MKVKRIKVAVFAFAAVAALGITACDKDMDDKKVEMNSSMTIENVVEMKTLAQTGMFKGVGGPGVEVPIVLPGSSISFSFYAGKGQRLGFTTMYGVSKDWFFAPGSEGMPLYDEAGKAMTGDVSAYIRLYDNGTKNNDSGDAEDDVITLVPDVDASGLMKLMLEYDATKSMFTLTITNTSGGTGFETPFSPGVWAISNIVGGELLNKYPLFERGKKTNAGITAIAEGGNNMPLYDELMKETGLITPLSPVLVVVHEGMTNPIFELNKKDKGNGLKEIAQGGDVTKLKAYLEKMDGVHKVYVLGDSPIMPGAKVSAQIQSNESSMISFVTMYGYSNDWFFGNEMPLASSYKGDATAKTLLLDNGTAVDQFPGAGNGQGIFGGMMYPEDKEIVAVGNQFPVPAVNKIIKVTIQ